MVIDVTLPGFVKVASAFTYILFSFLWMSRYVGYVHHVSACLHTQFTCKVLMAACHSHAYMMKVMVLIFGKAKHKVKDRTSICCAIMGSTWTGINLSAHHFLGWVAA